MRLLIISVVVLVNHRMVAALSPTIAQWLGIQDGTFDSPDRLTSPRLTTPSANDTTAPKPLISHRLTNSSAITTSITYICYNMEGQTGSLNVQSCTDAVRQLNIRSSTPAFWGMRNTGHHYSVYLPQRWVSADGSCFIEPILRQGFDSSITSARTLAMAGITLIQKCAASTPSKNGAAKNIGDDNKLAVVLSEWDPRVRCFGQISHPTASFQKNCKDVLNTMDVSEAEQRFGSPAAAGGVDVVLPFSLKVGYLDRCILTVKTSGPTDIFSWKSAWDAATAIHGICVRAGQLGIWDNLGESERLSVEITDDSISQE